MMNPKNALIVEDDFRQAGIFAQAMQAAGFRTEVINDGGEAIQRVDGDVPGVIVLDLHLPHASGEQILRKIQMDDRYEGAHIILATADPVTAEQYRTEVDLVFIKPVSYIQLRDLAIRLYPTT